MVNSGPGLGLDSVMGSGQTGGICQVSCPGSQSLHERLRWILWRDPPAVTKAQSPMETVTAQIGSRLASYHGFRNVCGWRLE